MYVVAYLRSSETDDARRKEAFEVQKFEIEDYCAVKGHSITRFIESRNPAPYLDCPQLDEALKANDEGIVVAYASVVTEHVTGANNFTALLERNKKKLLLAWSKKVIDPADAQSPTFISAWRAEMVVSSAPQGR